MCCEFDICKILKIINVSVLIILTIVLVIVCMNFQNNPNILVAIAEPRR